MLTYADVCWRVCSEQVAPRRPSALSSLAAALARSRPSLDVCTCVYVRAVLDMRAHTHTAHTHTHNLFLSLSVCVYVRMHIHTHTHTTHTHNTHTHTHILCLLWYTYYSIDPQIDPQNTYTFFMYYAPCRREKARRIL